MFTCQRKWNENWGPEKGTNNSSSSSDSSRNSNRNARNVHRSHSNMHLTYRLFVCLSHCSILCTSCRRIRFDFPLIVVCSNILCQPLFFSFFFSISLFFFLTLSLTHTLSLSLSFLLARSLSQASGIILSFRFGYRVIFWLTTLNNKCQNILDNQTNLNKSLFLTLSLSLSILEEIIGVGDNVVASARTATWWTIHTKSH